MNRRAYLCGAFVAKAKAGNTNRLPFASFRSPAPSGRPWPGDLEDAAGNPLAINGLWAISPGNSAAPGVSAFPGEIPGRYDPAGSPASELYFTAGPNHGTGGLFGYLKPVSTELIEGNDQ